MPAQSPAPVAAPIARAAAAAPAEAAPFTPSDTTSGATGYAGPGTPLPQAAVQALVARAQAGEAAAFARLYELYARKILAYLRYHLGGPGGAAGRAQAAEDLAADVFLKALEKLPGYRFSGVPFSAWLYRIAHNHLVDHLRALPKRQGVPLEACAAVDDPAAARALEGRLAGEQLAGALAGLTRAQRLVVHHRFLRDRSIAATARLLGKNEDAVKQLQVRALRNLRRAVAA